jgi:hypothetical protein
VVVLNIIASIDGVLFEIFHYRVCGFPSLSSSFVTLFRYSIAMRVYISGGFCEVLAVVAHYIKYTAFPVTWLMVVHFS